MIVNRAVNYHTCLSLQGLLMAKRMPKMQKFKPYLGTFLGIEHPFEEISQELNDFRENISTELVTMLMLALQESSPELIEQIESNVSWPSELAEQLLIWVEEDGPVIGFMEGEEAFNLEIGKEAQAPNPILRSNSFAKNLEDNFNTSLAERLEDIFYE